MKSLIYLLHERSYSCVVKNFNYVYTFSQQGIADLYDMVKNKPGFLNEALVADKVIGKAAASLLILSNISEIYAEVISLSALIMLRDTQIKTDFRRIVPFIWNQDQTDWCPLERICYNEKTAKDILPLIDDFISKQRNCYLLESTHYQKCILNNNIYKK